MVAMPPGWATVLQHPDGSWPKIVGQPAYLEHGEGDQPCMYWDVDLPERCHIPTSELSRRERWKLAWGVANKCDRHFWATADLPITIAAEG